MRRTWTIIGVGDVQRGFEWYQALFGQPATPPAHDYFGQILDSDGTVLLCLHKWGAHEHPSLMSPDNGTPGRPQCPTDVAVHQLSEYRLALMVVPGTLSGEPDCADQRVDLPIRSHTLATSRRLLQVQPAAVARRSCLAADR
jgi:hypothetical protein